MLANVARRSLVRKIHGIPVLSTWGQQKRGLARTPTPRDDSHKPSPSGSPSSTATSPAASSKPKLATAPPAVDASTDAAPTDPLSTMSPNEEVSVPARATSPSQPSLTPAKDSEEIPPVHPSAAVTAEILHKPADVVSNESVAASVTEGAAASSSQPEAPVVTSPAEARQAIQSAPRTPRTKAITPSKPKAEALKPLRRVVADPEEQFWHSQVIHGRSSLAAFRHPINYGVPVAMIHLRSYTPSLFPFFCHFIEHAAASLGIPVSGTATLPNRKSLWTVIKAPFVFKKSQENFQRIVHSRCIKAYDADPAVVDRWIKYIERHAQGGIGIRVVRWHRVPVGVGEMQMKRVLGRLHKKTKTSGEQVKALSQKIIAEEMKVVENAPPAP